jgi:hypothetical protein
VSLEKIKPFPEVAKKEHGETKHGKCMILTCMREKKKIEK